MEREFNPKPLQLVLENNATTKAPDHFFYEVIMPNEWLEIIREAAKLPALLADIYGDLLKPGVKQAGKALDTVIGLGNTVLWPVALANEKARIALERNLEKYRVQLEDIAEDRISAIPPEIGVPIAEKLSYVTDSELSNLYVNLLAKASTIDTSHFAHPSFVNVINNLCPDEAIYLKELHKRGELPFLIAKLVKKGANEWRTFGDLLTAIETNIQMTFPHNATAYLSNFEGLGLIQIRRDIFIIADGLYESLEAVYKPKYEDVPFDRETNEFKFERGKIEITPFGNLFMNACLTTLKQS